MSSINFDNPWLLLIALPLLVLILIPFFLAVRKGNRNVHNVGSCILHILIVICVAFSAAGTTMKTIVTETDVYVVADLSYSTQRNVDAIDGHIRKLKKNLPLNTKLGVVCFGADGAQVVHTRLGEEFKSVKGAIGQVGGLKLDADGTEIGCSSTDIVSALEYTGKIFKGGVVKRIVLITDGKQTNESDGALKNTVDALHTAKVYVDAIYLDSNLTAEAEEVQISNVTLPLEVYKGQPSEAEVFLQSSVETRATIKLLQGDVLVYSESGVVVGKGMGSISLPLKTDEVGKYAYTVEITDVAKDENLSNNVYRFSQRVTDSPRTLFITSDTEDVKLAKADMAIPAEDVYFVETGKSEVDKTEIPYTVEQLCQYDEIILSNVNIADIKNFVAFVNSLDAAVSILGKSLVGMGNLGLESVVQATESTTEHNALEMNAKAKLAGMLPVRYGDPAANGKIYALAFDISNSMELKEERFALAVAAAETLIDSFTEEDQVAIIGFHGSSNPIKALTGISDKASIKQALLDVLNNEGTEHGTVISGGLLGAAELLSEEIGGGKKIQICLITDGANESQDWTSLDNSISELYKKGVTTSALGIMPDGTNGRRLESVVNRYATSSNPVLYHQVDNSNTLKDLPSFVTGALVETYQKGDTVAKINQKYDEVLSGISRVTVLRGYVVGSVRPDATKVLTANYTPASEEERDSFEIPIYAYRKCGEGKTAAFMSSLSGAKYYWNRVKADDGENTIYAQFLENLLNVNVPQKRVSTPFITDVRQQGGQVLMEIRPAQMKADAVVELALTQPDGTREELGKLRLDANVYAYSYYMPSVGEYTLEITYSYGESYTVSYSSYLSYLPEYDSFTSFDAAPLYKMLGGNGTVSEDGDLEIVNDEDEVGVRIVDFTVPLLITAVSLFAIDVIVRKIKWADIKGLFRKVKKKEGKK